MALMRLWLLRKEGKTAEARVRQVPFGLELRIYYNGAFLRSEVVRVGRNVGDVAEEAKAKCSRGVGWPQKRRIVQTRKT